MFVHWVVCSMPGVHQQADHCNGVGMPTQVLGTTCPMFSALGTRRHMYSGGIGNTIGVCGGGLTKMVIS